MNRKVTYNSPSSKNDERQTRWVSMFLSELGTNFENAALVRAFEVEEFSFLYLCVRQAFDSNA